eukprot:1698780-Rhodomonas_salina.1
MVLPGIQVGGYADPMVQKNVVRDGLKGVLRESMMLPGIVVHDHATGHFLNNEIMRNGEKRTRFRADTELQTAFCTNCVCASPYTGPHTHKDNQYCSKTNSTATLAEGTQRVLCTVTSHAVPASVQNNQ